MVGERYVVLGAMLAADLAENAKFKDDFRPYVTVGTMTAAMAEVQRFGAKQRDSGRRDTRCLGCLVVSALAD